MSMIFKWTKVPTISRWKSPTYSRCMIAAFDLCLIIIFHSEEMFLYNRMLHYGSHTMSPKSTHVIIDRCFPQPRYVILQDSLGAPVGGCVLWVPFSNFSRLTHGLIAMVLWTLEKRKIRPVESENFPLAFLGAKHLSWGNQRVWSILPGPWSSEFQPEAEPSQPLGLQNNILWMLHFNWIFVSKFHPFPLGKYMKNLDLGVNLMVLVGISFQLLPDSQSLPNARVCHVMHRKNKTHISYIFPLHSAPEGLFMPPFF